MEYPLVTVCTLIYNTNPRYIIECIESIRENNYPNLQHIIVDDCSPDPQPKGAVKKWITENNYPCEFYENEKNLGICKNLNYALSLSKGKYFIGCNDDMLTKDRIINDVQTFEKLDDRYAIVFGMSQFMNSDSDLLPKTLPNSLINLPPDDNYSTILLRNLCLQAASTTYKTEILKKVGGFNENLAFEDYNIALRLSFSGYKFKNIPSINAYYRFHNESISSKLNFDLENIRMFCQYPNENNVQYVAWHRVWKMIFERKEGYRDAISIYISTFGKNWKLFIAGKTDSLILLRIINKLLKLDRW